MQRLIEQIDHLSLRDTKTLSQKGLKATEEVGELAKAILPYEGAHGTNHRIPSGDKVAEECADIILVAYSILKSMDYSLADIEKVIQRKTDYWQFLLDNEDKADLDNLAFEIHITVKEADLEPFKAACQTLGVKPIILDLYTDEDTVKDVMTSSVFHGSTKDVVNYTKALANQFRRQGFEVLREKIETVPWHPAAQVKPIREPGYFEAHFAFDTLHPSLLKDFCKTHNIHLSRNTMKKGDQSVMMGTYRRDALVVESSQFQNDVSNIRYFAEAAGHRVVKTPHTEYALFDTNEQHDRDWIAG